MDDPHKDEDNDQTNSAASSSADSVSVMSSASSLSPPSRLLHITILASGSRGDIQPYAVLAYGLQKRGHTVRLATEERMRPFVYTFPGVEYVHVSGDPTGVLFTEEGQRLLEQGNFFKVMAKGAETQKECYNDILNDYTNACLGWADVIITGPLSMTQALCIAEKMNVPCIPLALGPAFPTSTFPLWAISTSTLPFKFMNKLTYNVAFWMMWKVIICSLFHHFLYLFISVLSYKFNFTYIFLE
eukprot:TRINITY_DN13989_c0_g2_i1.p1 TRINITY_DN13989_c0_g2~~TRINITY_DN13989_c0_g2_i1.p1  ORF type:complete len:254 (+),score=45.06 TRINITY_DN13989_c0_g2_i1:34-762(+)